MAVGGGGNEKWEQQSLQWSVPLPTSAEATRENLGPPPLPSA